MVYRREKPESLEIKTFVTGVRAFSMLLLIIMGFGVVAGLLLGWLGVYLVLHGSITAASSIHLFGQSIDTQSVGVACIAIAAIVIVVTIRGAYRNLKEFLEYLKHRNAG
jgi:hypothetical protein